MMSIQKVW